MKGIMPSLEGVSTMLARLPYNECLEALGLTQKGAGDFLCVNHRTSRRWASGKDTPPPAVQMLLTLLVERSVTPEEAYTLTYGKAPDEPFRGDRRKRAE